MKILKKEWFIWKFWIKVGSREKEGGGNEIHDPCACGQKSSGWKCFINFRQVTKWYYFKEYTDDFRKFDGYTVYNALNCDAFFFFIVQHSSIVLTRIILRPLSALPLDECRHLSWFCIHVYLIIYHPFSTVVICFLKPSLAYLKLLKCIRDSLQFKNNDNIFLEIFVSYSEFGNFVITFIYF